MRDTIDNLTIQPQNYVVKWHDPTFYTGVTRYANAMSRPKPGLGLLPTGEVVMRGLLDVGAGAPVLLFQLPAFLFTDCEQVFPCVSYNNTSASFVTGILIVRVAGYVEVAGFAANTEWVSLDGIRYFLKGTV